MIIGFSGPLGSGKGEAIAYLKTKEFIAYSLSDVIREELRARKREITRESMIEVGNELRKNFGNNILAERIICKLKKESNYAIDSIRNPEEINSFRKIQDFALVYVDAPQKIRFMRLVNRGRHGDPKTFSHFKKLDDFEMTGKSESSQQINTCKGMADIILLNDSTIEKLHYKIELILLDLKKTLLRKKRPSTEEYFMKIAEVVSQKSNCLRRQIGAVLVKDKMILSTGYNGTPRGVKNCIDGGCKRCDSIGESGKDLDICICVHAEENAIIQAAYHGTRIKDSTLYTTFCPCIYCAKSIINSGIKKVVYRKVYTKEMTKQAIELFKEAGVELVRIE